jgi:hypothetical protein
LVNAAQRNFGRRLRDQREGAQIALSEIAEATKIKRADAGLRTQRGNGVPDRSD